MGVSKDKLYLMTYLECEWVENRSYVRTYERIELEDYIKMVLRVKCRHSGESLYNRDEVIEDLKELESDECINHGAYYETIFNPCVLIKTNSKANAKKLIVAMEKRIMKRQEERRIRYLEMGYHNDWDY
jgi:hypothetical protein